MIRLTSILLLVTLAAASAAVAGPLRVMSCKVFSSTDQGEALVVTKLTDGDKAAPGWSSGAFADVTELIKEMAEEGTRKIPASITLFGVDPAFGEVKSLTITYTLNGKKSTDTVTENHVLELP